MKPLYEVGYIAEVDKYAITEKNFPSLILMENATESLIEIITAELSGKVPGNKVAILCGKGNNGGDGLSLARKFLLRNFEVTVCLTGEPSSFSEDAYANYQILESSPEHFDQLSFLRLDKVNDYNLLKGYDIYIDALLGSGSKGELNSLYRGIIETVNGLEGYKIAVDIPTGGNADTGSTDKVCFYANLTVALGGLKQGLFYGDLFGFAGKIVLGDIGLPNSFYDASKGKSHLIEASDVVSLLPKRKKNSNKYSVGITAIIAGSKQYKGAGVLASVASSKSGVGGSFVFTSNEATEALLTHSPECIMVSYGENEKFTELNISFLETGSDILNKANSICIGPGLGKSEGAVEAVKYILGNYGDKSILIDADAISIITDANYKNFDLKRKVLTPHLGEFARLMGVKSEEIRRDVIGYGKKFVSETEAVLVLKGPSTILFIEDEIFVVASGSAALARFGSGDVLSGFMAGLLAQTDVKSAIFAAVYIHGEAGKRGAELESVYGVTPGVVLSDYLSKVIIELGINEII